MTAPTEDLIAAQTEALVQLLAPDQGESATPAFRLALHLQSDVRALQQEVERLRGAWSLCVEMVAAEDGLIAELIDDERYLDAMKMDFPITNRMRAMIARSALTGSAQG